MLVFAAACSGNSNNEGGGHFDAQFIDAPKSVPVLTSFAATPNQLPAGVATPVTWTWTYQDQPTVPDPACSIDNGVGPVTQGQTTMVTITTVTTFTLTCTNALGSGARQVVIGVPPIAPVISSFTATPGLVTTNASTPITWTWTYSTPPSPTPVCTIEHGVGTVTSGAQTSVTQRTSRTYQLRCTNAQGFSTATATINVNECTDATADCQVNANCTDTNNGYTCTCKSGYNGNGDVCSAAAACGATPSLCSTNATCQGGGTYCQCNAGYVGDGLTCTKLKYEFVTSTTGSGNISTWTGAGGATGLAAADNVCAARASAAGLTGTFVAWMSDSNNDAYCRVNGYTGKKAANCGQSTLPVVAGPWVRPFTTTATAPSIDKLVAPNRITYTPANVNESGTAVSVSDRVYTGTDDTGAAVTNTCTDWTSTATQGAMGDVSGGGTSWTRYTATDPACTTTGHLRCMEAGGAGPALPSRHPSGTRKAFLTSVSGTGQFSTWADAGPQTGLLAANAVCQARARYAGFANAQNFKAWVASSTSLTSLIFYNGPWVRPDGIQIAASYNALFSNGRFDAPLYQMETGAYAQGNQDAGSVWTGASQYGSATFTYCNVWTQGTTSYSGTTGRFDLGDYRATDYTSSLCNATQQIYCFEDD